MSNEEVEYYYDRLNKEEQDNIVGFIKGSMFIYYYGFFNGTFKRKQVAMLDYVLGSVNGPLMPLDNPTEAEHKLMLNYKKRLFKEQLQQILQD